MSPQSRRRGAADVPRNAFDTHGVRAVSLLLSMKYGAGTLSLDQLIDHYREGAISPDPWW
jgi:hypothetical protein